ncbi:MAG: hypothetical protein BWY46_00384 [Firmicutes bacterium ADurb.Bin300]|nr:MAG: hypothetical protein BWY46_00384 [Firmicutes bacterium ADurb.Bin300]
MIEIRNNLLKSVSLPGLHDCAAFSLDNDESMLQKAASIEVLSTENEDIRSLREMINSSSVGDNSS